LGTQSGVNAFGHKTQGGGQRQPDPTRTSVDLMTERKRGGGGYGRRNGGGGGGGGRSGGGRKGGGGGFGGGGFSR
jgi:ATP-dependent RNA helicase RhlE